VAMMLQNQWVKSVKDWDRVLLFSFYLDELAAVRTVNRDARLVLLQHINPYHFLKVDKRLALFGVAFYHRFLPERALKQADKQSLLTIAYTVDSPQKAAELERRGVKAIVTNHPDRPFTGRTDRQTFDGPDIHELPVQLSHLRPPR